MATTIKIKSSSVEGRAPSSLSPAELAVNLKDRKLFTADGDGVVFELGGAVTSVNGKDGDVTLALNDLTDVEVGSVTNNQVLAYNGGNWVPVSAASLSVDVDLGYTAAADKGTVTNSAGDNAEIPLGNGTNAGLSLNNYTTADKDKLQGITPGADVTPDLSDYLQSGDNVSELVNDANYITLADVPVTSVNGETGDVVLSADDVGALPADTPLDFVPLGAWTAIPELS